MILESRVITVPIEIALQLAIWWRQLDEFEYLVKKKLVQYKIENLKV